MKVLQINNCHRRRGGADIVYLETGEMLERHGIEVFYFSTESELNVPCKNSSYFVNHLNPLNLSFIKQVLITPTLLYSIQSKKNLEKLIIQNLPDVAHIHLYKGELTASIFTVLKKYKIPTVITLHDYSLICPRNIFFNSKNEICELCVHGNPINCVIHKCNRGNFFYSTINYVEYLINNKLFKPSDIFDKIICVSKFNYLKHIESKPKLSNRLSLLYNFTPFLSRKQISVSNQKYFLFYGRLSNEKGIQTLINAFKAIGSIVNIKIVGEGPLFPNLNKELKSYTNIELLGFKSGFELETLILNASFVIVPSEWYENNPLTIVESLSCGKPVIGSNIGGIPELIENGKTGFTFEMGNMNDLIRAILLAHNTSDIEYIEMSRNARAFAERKFSEENHYIQLINIYKDAISNKKRLRIT